jgi:hypothetical protein
VFFFYFPAVVIDSQSGETDDEPRMGGYETSLASQHYPKLQTICFTLGELATPRDYVAVVLSSITSAQKLSEVSFVFTRMILDQDLDLAVSQVGWGPVDDQLGRLARQATGGVTASFDFITQPGWTPRRDGAGMSFMRRFRKFGGVMKLRSSGEEVATYGPRG